MLKPEAAAAIIEGLLLAEHAKDLRAGLWLASGPARSMAARPMSALKAAYAVGVSYE